MRNKKALLENTLKVVIAVVGIGIIFFGAAKLYTSYLDDTPEKAKSLATLIEAKSKAAIASQEKQVNLTIQGFDETWFLHGFDESNPDRPEECFLKPCICVCPGISTEDCKVKDAACRTFENLKQLNVSEYSIREIPQERGPIRLGLKSGPIRLPPKLIELKLTNEEEKLKIEIFSEEYYKNYAEYKQKYPGSPLPRELK